MDFDSNVEFLRLAFYQIILTAGPLLAVALGVGLIIGIIQAATFALLANFMLVSLSDYFLFIFDRVAGMGYS